MAYFFYASSLNWFEAHKSEEKVNALKLVDAFVTNYSELREKFTDQAPVPATFRAHSIDLFNKGNGDASEFHLLWVGRKGRAIATPPADEEMAQSIESFATEREPKAVANFLTVNGQLVFRTIYPSFARQDSCVDCHNKIQPDQHWKLGDLMGAFSIDVPAASFIRTSVLQAIGLGFAIFIVLGAMGLAFALLQFGVMSEREAAQAELGRRVDERTAELRQVQDELLRKERLSTLGQITATVAHELRNPLSAISNTAFLVKQSVANAGLSLERPMTRLERSIRRCDRIIEDLLDFTRARGIKRRTLDADQWLELLLGEQQMPPGIELRSELGARGHQVAFDPERMRRVVINLLDNAAQAIVDSEQTRPERRITVRTRAIGNQFEIAIEDTGPGISPETLGKVFDPLFSTKSFGTGLGLPTVKQIVEQHGGTVEISSQLGKGTTVLVRLPGVMNDELAA